jgi:hypothetical protein
MLELLHAIDADVEAAVCGDGYRAGNGIDNFGEGVAFAGGDSNGGIKLESDALVGGGWIVEID